MCQSKGIIVRFRCSFRDVLPIVLIFHPIFVQICYTTIIGTEKFDLPCAFRNALLLHCTHRDQRPHRHVVTGCDGIKSCAWKQGFVWHGHGPRLSKTIFIVAMHRPRFVLQSLVFKGANPTQSEFRIVQHGSFSVHDVGLQSCFLEICFHKQQIDNCIGMY